MKPVEKPSIRVRANLKALLDEHMLTQREFARQMGKSQPWIQKILDGDNDLRLDDLDQAADILKVPTAELLRQPEDELIEVRPTELAMVRALRALPPDLSRHVSMVIHELHVGARLRTRKSLKNTTASENTAPMSEGVYGGGTIAAAVVALGAELTSLAHRIAEVETSAADRDHAAARGRHKAGRG